MDGCLRNINQTQRKRMRKSLICGKENSHKNKVNSPEDDSCQSKCCCADESYIYRQDLSLGNSGKKCKQLILNFSGNYTLSGNYSRFSLPSSQLYSKVNKKMDQKQKSDIKRAEIVSVELKETDIIEAVKDEVQKDDPKYWKELKERNFTLEEILSLETNNEVTFMTLFTFPKTIANLLRSF